MCVCMYTCMYVCMYVWRRSSSCLCVNLYIQRCAYIYCMNDMRHVVFCTVVRMRARIRLLRTHCTCLLAYHVFLLTVCIQNTRPLYRQTDIPRFFNVVCLLHVHIRVTVHCVLATRAYSCDCTLCIGEFKKAFSLIFTAKFSLIKGVFSLFAGYMDVFVMYDYVSMSKKCMMVY